MRVFNWPRVTPRLSLPQVRYACRIAAPLTLCSQLGNRALFSVIAPSGEGTVLVVDPGRNQDAIPNLSRMWREVFDQRVAENDQLEEAGAAVLPNATCHFQSSLASNNFDLG